jgi:tetratricopeptide (TPR) repeat protein
MMFGKLYQRSVMLALQSLALCMSVQMSAIGQTLADAAAPNGTLDPLYRPTAPTAVVKPSVAQPTPEQNAIAPEIAQLYEVGRYFDSAKAGAKRLVVEPNNIDLRLLVANSLSWSGRLDAAIEQYERLIKTRLESAAKIGIANIYRWRGKPELAEPLFDQVLAREPNNPDALEGKKLADRQMRLSILKGLTFTRDSSGLMRIDSTTSFGKVNQDRTLRWRAGYALARDKDVSGKERYAELSGMIKALNAPLTPTASAWIVRDHSKVRVFGLVQADLIEDTLGVHFGRVNWGRQSFNSAAAASLLSAKRLGAYLNVSTPLGESRSKFDSYRISGTSSAAPLLTVQPNDNFVWDAETQLTPAWQPLPSGFIWYAGVSAKAADRTDSRYWSPSSTYVLGILGLKKAWYFDKGDVGFSVQRGFKISDEARNNLSISANAKYWLSDVTALGFELSASNSPRPSDYRQRYLNLQLERLW